jgi:hypothetical protein
MRSDRSRIGRAREQAGQIGCALPVAVSKRRPKGGYGQQRQSPSSEERAAFGEPNRAEDRGDQRGVDDEARREHQPEHRQVVGEVPRQRKQIVAFDRQMTA